MSFRLRCVCCSTDQKSTSAELSSIGALLSAGVPGAEVAAGAREISGGGPSWRAAGCSAPLRVEMTESVVVRRMIAEPPPLGRLIAPSEVCECDAERLPAGGRRGVLLAWWPGPLGTHTCEEPLTRFSRCAAMPWSAGASAMAPVLQRAFWPGVAIAPAALLRIYSLMR
jgi:hypothetical protein